MLCHKTSKTQILCTFIKTKVTAVARIRWFHKVTNYEVLSRCKINSLESIIDKAKLRWTGHVIRMEHTRIPKQLLYGRLATGRPRRGNHNTYLNSVKRTLRACDIDYTCLTKLVSERNNWCATVRRGILKAEENHIDNLISKRMRRKAGAYVAHLCGSRIAQDIPNPTSLPQS